MGNRKSRGDGGAAQRTAQIQAQENARVAIAAQQAQTERLRLQAQKEEKDRDLKNKQYEREHAVKMEQIRNENKRKEREAMAAMERAKQENAKRLEQMRIAAQERDKKSRIAQKEANLANIAAELNKLDGLINRDTKDLEQTQEALEKICKEQEVQQQLIANFDNYKQVELDKVSDDLQLKTAHQTFDNADKQIKAAINKCGQIEQNVGRFLTLTHSLLGATIATTSHSNKLDAEITTFGELVSRECQDKLTVEQYFGDKNLKRFIPILAKEDFKNVESLKCTDEDEYNEILCLIESGVKKLMEEEKGDDEKEEEAIDGEALLKKWGFSKYWDALVEAECTDPNDWKYLEEDDLKEMGFKNFQIKKFNKKLMEFAQETNVISMQEARLLKETCMQLRDIYMLPLV